MATGCSGSAMVSPMVMSSMPARQTMSPGRRFFDLDALQSFEGIQLRDLGLLRFAVELADRRPDRRWRTRAVEDAANGDAAKVVAIVEVGDQQLKVRLGSHCRRRDVFHDRVEERAQILASVCQVDAWRVPARPLV